MKDFYGITAGCWITVILANRHLFLFEETLDPQHTPPNILLLLDQSANTYRNSFLTYGSAALCLPTLFHDFIVKELTPDDATSGILKMNWPGFCHDALPFQRKYLSVIDYLGYSKKLQMDFNYDKTVSCIFFLVLCHYDMFCSVSLILLSHI